MRRPYSSRASRPRRRSAPFATDGSVRFSVRALLGELARVLTRDEPAIVHLPASELASIGLMLPWANHVACISRAAFACGFAVIYPRTTRSNAAARHDRLTSTFLPDRLTFSIASHARRQEISRLAISCFPRETGIFFLHCEIGYSAPAFRGESPGPSTVDHFGERPCSTTARALYRGCMPNGRRWWRSARQFSIPLRGRHFNSECS